VEPNSGSKMETFWTKIGAKQWTKNGNTTKIRYTWDQKWKHSGPKLEPNSGSKLETQPKLDTLGIKNGNILDQKWKHPGPKLEPNSGSKLETYRLKNRNTTQIRYTWDQK
jgi:hypothetical protein